MRRNQRKRAGFRAVGFITLVLGALLLGVLTETISEDVEDQVDNHWFRRNLEARRTEEGVLEVCDDAKKVENKLLLIPYAAGVLYMFVAIAIICDEFFVPALEEMASENYLNLSMDVAGATLMAAGGSAPELFTSLIGTFQESEVGFGTIVGSAVFNVLFVIGMCAMFSKEILTLTWWPLARDCAYYSLGLLVLAVFCGYTSPGEIVLWEAVAQFVLYIGYVVFMKYNETIYKKIQRGSSSARVGSDAEIEEKESHTIKQKPATFRAGLLTLFMGKGSFLDKVGIGMVTKISGDVGTVFKKLDKSGDGFIDRTEFHNLVEMLDCAFTEEEISAALAELDDNGDSKIDLVEFTKWYIKSETRLRTEIRSTFDRFDADKSGTIDADELDQLLRTLGAEVTRDDLKEIFQDTYVSGATDQITYEEFEAWYTQSSHWTDQKAKVHECTEEAVEPISDHLKPPKGGSLFDYVRWAVLFPIIIILCITVPDVRLPGKDKYCFIGFFFSILWIGCFTYFMVQWAEVIGNTLGIPMVLMGLTLLAAGTSVPDLLSSVIVARMGEGDMAVSSSIGSNIFDITVGLPVPWILFIVSGKKSVTIGTEGMEVSIIILLFMLLAIVTIIHFSGWKMTKGLGLSMFFLYFLYLAQAIIRQLPFAPC